MSAQASLFPSADDTARTEFLEVLHALERSRGLPRSNARVTGTSFTSSGALTLYAFVDGRPHSAVGVASGLGGDAARVVFDAIHGGLR